MTLEQMESKEKLWWWEEEEAEASVGVDICKSKEVLDSCQ